VLLGNWRRQSEVLWKPSVWKRTGWFSTGWRSSVFVSLLMPLDVEWADLHALAVEDYVTERDPEAAKNLCVVLEKRDRRQKTGCELPAAKDGASRKTGARVPKQGQESQTKHSRRQRLPQTEGWRWQEILKSRARRLRSRSWGFKISIS
jgi:hypothetical protein